MIPSQHITSIVKNLQIRSTECDNGNDINLSSSIGPQETNSKDIERLKWVKLNYPPLFQQPKKVLGEILRQVTENEVQFSSIFQNYVNLLLQEPVNKNTKVKPIKCPDIAMVIIDKLSISKLLEPGSEIYAISKYL